MEMFLRLTPPHRLIVVAAIGALMVPFLVGSYGIYIVSLMMLHVILAVSYNFLIGYANQFSLGHVAIYGMGAYGTGIAITQFNLPYVLAIPVGALTATVGGMLVALPALRLRVFYLAIATLALTMMFHWILIHGGTITGGGSGLRPGRPDFSFIGVSADIGGYYIIWALTVLLIFLSYRIVASPVGRRWLCLGAREHIAEALGISVYRTKVEVFASTGLIAGLAGSMSVVLLGFADPMTFYIINLILFFMFVIVGGRGYIVGGFIGAVTLTGLWEGLRVFEGLHEIALGMVLLITVVLMPDGISGALARRYDSWREQRHLHHEPDSLTDGIRGGGASLFTQTASVADGGPASVMTDNQPALQIDGLCKAFGGVRAVNELTLSFKQGQVHGVIGPNGSGKSTLLNLISGVERSDAGRIVILGQDVTDLAASARTRLGVSRTFQECQLVPNLSVLENVLLGSDYARTGNAVGSILANATFRAEERFAVERARWALDFVTMSHLENHRGGDLSGGQMRLVEIARAIVGGAPIILLDEPAAGLSLNRIDDLAVLIQKMKLELGITVILVEHVLNLVLGISDDVAVMNAGELLFRGTSQEARNNDQVRKAYLGSH